MRTKSEVVHKWANWLHNPYLPRTNENWPGNGRIGDIILALRGGGGAYAPPTLARKA